MNWEWARFNMGKDDETHADKRSNRDRRFLPLMLGAAAEEEEAAGKEALEEFSEMLTAWNSNEAG
jgi:hypothetical protein